VTLIYWLFFIGNIPLFMIMYAFIKSFDERHDNDCYIAYTALMLVYIFIETMIVCEGVHNLIK